MKFQKYVLLSLLLISSLFSLVGKCDICITNSSLSKRTMTWVNLKGLKKVLWPSAGSIWPLKQKLPSHERPTCQTGSFLHTAYVDLSSHPFPAGTSQRCCSKCETWGQAAIHRVCVFFVCLVVARWKMGLAQLIPHKCWMPSLGTGIS